MCNLLVSNLAQMRLLGTVVSMVSVLASESAWALV